MPKEFDMKKFITENRVTYPVVGTPAIGTPIHRSPHESPALDEATEFGVDSAGLKAAMREFERVVPYDIQSNRLAQIIRAYLSAAK